MRKLIVVSLFLMIASLIFAQTDVSGDVSGHWTLVNSPYNVTGDIMLQSGNTLVIDPGVQVTFGGHYKFDVNGKLLANGDENNHILFTATDHQTGWSGIRFSNINSNGQDTTKVFYCDFEYGLANGSESSGGAIYLKNSDVYFNHVTVSNNQALGYGGGIYMESSSPILHNVEVFNNVATFDGGGIYCGFTSHPDFYRVVIAHNSTQWNGGGIAFFNDSDATLINVTIANNHADQDGSSISAVYETTITILNSILWNNGYPEIYWNNSSAVNATYCDIQYGTNQSYFGVGCLDEDPMFVNADNNDYSLNGHSPCINAGSPDQAYLDPDGTVADMGAYYHAVSGVRGEIEINLAGNDVTTTFADVTVFLAGVDTVQTVPDSNGVYYFIADPGVYEVWATLPGYFSSPIDPIPDIHVQDSTVTYVPTITFNPPQEGTVWGHAEVEGDGDITAIVIDIDGITSNPHPVYNGDVIDHYEYTVENIPQGTHNFRATLPGYESYTIDNLIVPPHALIREDISMHIVQNPGTVTGSVVLKGADGTGTGPGDITQVLITDGIHETHPDASGNFTLNTYSGIQNITASLDHYNFVTLPAIVLSGQTTTGLDFVLLNWDPITGNQYSMTLFATMSYDGDFLQGKSNNSVAVFGPGGINDCRGIATWVEGNHPQWSTDLYYYNLPGYWYMTPVSDVHGDLYHPENCEQLTFKVYNSDTDEVLDCHGSLGFVDLANMSKNIEAFSPIHTQEFSLINDWNWISFNMRTYDNTIGTIFSSLTPNNDIKEIKWENYDEQYWEPNWIGDFPDSLLQPNYGLKIFMNNSANFSFSGQKINSIIYHNHLHFVDTLEVSHFYDWVSYYPYDELPLNIALASLGNKVRSVKGQSKSAYLDDSGNWVGDLTLLKPGESYIIETYIEGPDPTDPPILIYPTEYYYGNLISKGISDEEVENPAGWNLIKGNASNMIFMADIKANSDSYELGIFDNNNECRSIGKYTNGFWYFTVLGDEPENLSIKAYNKSTGETTAIEYTLPYEANTILGTPDKPIAIEFNGQNNPAVASKILKGNYPNPFNPQTQINFAIPSEGNVKLSVYNIKGQLVETLVNEKLNAGEHSKVWDASAYGSGVYFYKLTYNGKSEIKKCIMLK